jgi:hypothetical protein
LHPWRLSPLSGNLQTFSRWENTMSVIRTLQDHELGFVTGGGGVASKIDDLAGDVSKASAGEMISHGLETVCQPVFASPRHAGR